MTSGRSTASVSLLAQIIRFHDERNSNKLFKKASYSLAFVLLSLFALSAQAALEVTGYELVNKTRAGRFNYDYTYRVILSNTDGTNVDNVLVMVTSDSPRTQIIDSEVTLPTIGAGETLTTEDTITIRQNRRYPFDPESLNIDVSADISISGLVVDDPIESAIITLVSESGTTLGTAVTDANGYYSVTLLYSDLQEPFYVISTGGFINGEAFDGTMQAIYDLSDNLADANITPVTTVITGLADTMGSGLIENRNAALDQTTSMMLFPIDEWNSIEPTGVNLEQIRFGSVLNGFNTIIANLVSDIQDGDITLSTFNVFPSFNFGLLSAVIPTNNRVFMNVGEVEMRDISVSPPWNTAWSAEVIEDSSPDWITIDQTGRKVIFNNPTGAGRYDFRVLVTTQDGGERTINAMVTVDRTNYEQEYTITGENQWIELPDQGIRLFIPAGSTNATNLRVSGDYPSDQNYTIRFNLTDGEVNPGYVITAEILQSRNLTGEISSDAWSDACFNDDGYLPSYPLLEYASFYYDSIDIDDHRVLNKSTINLLVEGPSSVTLKRDKAAVLCSYMDEDSIQTLNAIDNYEPVLFINGFTFDSKIGGGYGTWADLQELLRNNTSSSNSILPFEFRWATNTRFQDAAKDLASTVSYISQLTGKHVHIVAHSFGGILARTYLQGLATSDSFYSTPVASLTTIGTPHSGIFGLEQTVAGIDFPSGIDDVMGGLIPYCAQATCYQMGSSLWVINQDYINLQRRRFMDRENINGIEFGEIVVALNESQNQYRVNSLPIQVLIGLREGFLCTDPFCHFSDGDGLISRQGQRYTPSQDNLSIECVANISNVQVTEHFLGLTGSPSIYNTCSTSSLVINDVITGEAVSDVVDEFHGYGHTSLHFWGNSRKEVAVDLDDDEHPTYLRILSWVDNYPAETINSQPPNADGIIAYYDFNDNANDSSGYENNGNEQGGLFYTTGVEGSAANFNGQTTYIEVPDAPSLDFTTAFSINAWIRVAGDTGQSQRIISKWTIGSPSSPEQNEFSFAIDGQSGALTNDSLNFSYANDTHHIVDMGNLSDGNWHMATATYDGNNSRLYIDGRLVGEMTAGLTAQNGTNPMYIGGGASTSPMPAYIFNGQIDELKIYNRAITSNEVQDLCDEFGCPSPGSNQNGLLAHYPFDGNTVDVSGNGNNNAIVNASLTTDPHGNTNSAYYFDGIDDYIRINNFTVNLDEFTIALWARTDSPVSVSTGQGHRGLISMHSGEIGHYAGGDMNAAIHFRELTSNYQGHPNLEQTLLPRISTQNNTPSAWITSTDASLVSGQWRHVVYTRHIDGSLQMYMDGQAVTNPVTRDAISNFTNPTDNLTFSNGYLEIGTRNFYGPGTGWSYFQGTNWHGAIDDVRVYDRALSPSEVAEICIEVNCSDTQTNIVSVNFEQNSVQTLDTYQGHPILQLTTNFSASGVHSAHSITDIGLLKKEFTPITSGIVKMTCMMSLQGNEPNSYSRCSMGSVFDSTIGDLGIGMAFASDPGFADGFQTTIWNNGVFSSTNGIQSVNSGLWYKLAIEYDFSSSVVTYLINDSIVGQQNIVLDAIRYFSVGDSSSLGGMGGGAESVSDNIYIDDIYVTNYH
ncbi:MAG: LamG-like jellyroll fold domain-containing protein [Candidatus Thiodiazotropha sp.]